MDATSVTGVSRSGRVRKKSSKLIDFESPDEIETARYSGRRKDAVSEGEESENEGPEHIREEEFDSIPDVGAEWDHEDLVPRKHGDNENRIVNPEREEEEEEKGNLLIDDDVKSLRKTSRFRRESTKNNRKQTSSLKKGNHHHHHHQGVTAYALWAKGARLKILKSSPRMEFNRLSQRLKESWSSLSRREILSWKNRADRFNSSTLKGTNTGKAQRTSFSFPKGPKSSSQDKAMNPSTSASQSLIQNSALYKVVGTEPIDTAAHLKLLGESLSIIGERLTEHEGQIAVSGSLSVLLDSLLCAMGPLMCLTQQVPELNAIPQNKLSTILDNVAYIMPGL